ncbi:Bifunctional solanapyrone synthase [Cytospora mali]|uniref:Bifunctional solanapyrone synthase n=1 Tax=Cytospora mali TaxID=578113 RepID=A0A194VN01_CYTMA|nr:Bifunctional solanapyrone synthase [Valsa mali]
MASIHKHSDPSAVAGLLAAGLQVLRPGDEQYVIRQDSYWSSTARLSPVCIVRPRSAEEVSTTIKILVAAGQKFAIRSGGHTQFAGGNNIDGGVTIDLGLLDWTRFDKTSETVDIGPGGRWQQVYGELHKHGRVVSGGRDGHVGVGGILLGGGKTFFTAQRGFGCDDIVAYEVVLGDGRIVTADAIDNEDLFRCLKGGGNNFGIVTNFRMNALQTDSIWGGLNVFPKSVTQEAVEALVDFTDHPEFKDTVIVAAYVQIAGVERESAYNQFLRLPAAVDTTKMTTIKDVVDEYDIAPLNHQLWNNPSGIFFTATVKNDHRIVMKASELHDQVTEQLKDFIPDGDFITQCLVQPLPVLYGQRSEKAGGNIMGVEKQSINGLLFVAVVMVKTSEQESFAYPKVKAWIDSLKEFAATIENGNLPWIYLNYADKSQEVLASYGGENVRRMKDVAAKYDPLQVFQKLCPGGFKVCNIRH